LIGTFGGQATLVCWPAELVATQSFGRVSALRPTLLPQFDPPPDEVAALEEQPAAELGSTWNASVFPTAKFLNDARSFTASLMSAPVAFTRTLMVPALASMAIIAQHGAPAANLVCAALTPLCALRDAGAIAAAMHNATSAIAGHIGVLFSIPYLL